MTTTTTAANACNAVIWLDSSAGAPTNIQGSSTKVTMGLKNDLGEYKVFADRWKYREQCGADWSVTLEVVYSTTASEGFTLLKDWFFSGSATTRSVRIQMPDGSTGSDQYDGEMLLETLDWDMAADEAGPVIVTAGLLPNGALTHNVIGS
jgi:hypothetical protein